MAGDAQSDASWEHIAERSKKLAPHVKKAWSSSRYEARYVPTRDGVRLATDIYLPSELHCGPRCPTVFFQSRYMRSLSLRWPFSLLTNGLPVDLINHDLKAQLLAAGYAVVSCDVRGTGASFGRWRSLWGPEEQDDSVQLLDWIIEQPWCSGQIILVGVSYEAGAALSTLARCHPAVKAAVLLYPFWDLYNDISFPGGVPQRYFTESWNSICQCLDSNDLGGLSYLLKLIFSGVQPVIAEQRPRGSLLNPLSWVAHWRYQKARAAGLKLLEQAVAEHESFSAKEAMNVIRFADQVDPQSGLTITEASACSKAQAIAAAGVPMLLLAGWMDQTASAAISAFVHGAQHQGSKLILGPWTHGGLLNNSVGHIPSGVPAKFNSAGHVLKFIAEALHPSAAYGSKSGGVQGVSDISAEDDGIHYYVMGHHASWRSCTAWPPTHSTAHLFISGPDTDSILLSETPSASGHIGLTGNREKYPQGFSRYEAMTDLRRPLAYTNLKACGHLVFSSPPLKSSFELIGWPEVVLWIQSDLADADIFCYLESFDPANNSVAYITEGAFRASHRKLIEASADEHRHYALPAGLPHHTFRTEDALALERGSPACCHFTLMPTAYCFAPGHCIRIALSGSDAKHFYSDSASGTELKLWIHFGGDSASQVILPGMEALQI